MLQRKEGDGVVLISQPAHSWVAGQLARVWGNEIVGDYTPRDEVYQAAALHDIGFLNWEQNPTLNPATGLPHCFRDLPSEVHFDLWTKSVRKMMRYGRYPALLVSLHFVNLSQKQRKTNSSKELELKQSFLKDQEIMQTTLMTSLQNDFYYAPCATTEILERNKRLMAVWDWLSLALCIGFEGETTLEDVPMSKGAGALTLKKESGSRVRVRPWPFHHETGYAVKLVCEGRRLLSTFTNQDQMREAIQGASPACIQVELVAR